MQYKYIIFDADETLFHFDAYRGLQLMFQQYGVDFTPEQYDEYQTVNAPLWLDYQAGTITADTLQVTRFSAWANQLNVDPHELNEAFQLTMAEICEPLPGAHSLVEKLSQVATLAIITNGFSAMQKRRLERTGLLPFFKSVVISELVGVAKPDPKIFEYTLEQLDNPAKTDVLMVGDTPSSDILGANNFGVDSCWLAHPGKKCPPDIAATHTVKTLPELERLLLGS